MICLAIRISLTTSRKILNTLSILKQHRQQLTAWEDATDDKADYRLAERN